MRRRDFLTRLTRWAMAGSACGLAGCGTVFYGERVGQPHSHNIDWKIAALNGLGLLLFFVPGVIAFAVDFYTGAIYLPLECPCEYPRNPAFSRRPTQLSPQPTVASPNAMQGAYPASPPATSQPHGPMAWQVAHPGDLQRVMVPRRELERERIESIVSHRLGRPISLLDAHTRVSELPRLDRFAEQRRRHAHDVGFGMPARSFFASLSVAEACEGDLS